MYLLDDKPLIYYILVICIFLILGVVFVLLYLTPRKTSSNIGITQITYTGIGMPCGDIIRCETGECIQTSIGNVCLSNLGQECGNLQQCINQAKLCDGRCINHPGSLGSLCDESVVCDPGLVCTASGDGNRCLIPNSGSGCQSSLDCPEGDVCLQGVCQTGLAPYQTCTNSAECSMNNICLNGKCQPADSTQPGSLGSYCESDIECKSGLKCQFSSSYNLPNQVGYCVNPVSLLGQECTRYIGCVPVGVCQSDGRCGMPSPLESCVNNLCSIGLSCVDNVCKSLTLCGNNQDCVSGNCNNYNLVQLQIQDQPGDYIYKWEKLSNSSSVTDLSMIETSASKTTFCLYQNRDNFITLIDSNFNSTQINFEFDVPDGFQFNFIISAKIFQGDIIVLKVNLNQAEFGYDKLIYRNLSEIIGRLNYTWILTSQECQAYTYQSRQIQTVNFFTYDNLGEYFFISADNKTSGYYFTKDNEGDVSYLLQGANNLIFISHYTSVYSPGYDPRTVVLISFINGNYCLWNYQPSLGPSLNLTFEQEPKSFCLNFSFVNQINNFQFLFYTDLYYRGSFTNGVWSLIPVQAYLAQDNSDIIQSTFEANLFYINGKGCS